MVASGSDYLVITSSGNSGGFYYDLRDNHLGVGRLPHISNASGLTVGGLTSGSKLHMSSHITASGNISASGTGSFGYVEASGLVNRANDSNT